MNYTLTEYDDLSGHGKIIARGDCAEELFRVDFDPVNIYIVRADGTDLAVFDGVSVDIVCDWFADNPDYDGWDGSVAWCD